MRTSLLSLCGVLISFVGVAVSHNIQMGAHARECFHEQLHKDDKMTVTFQVGDREFGGAGNLEIDFWVGSTFLAFAPPKLARRPPSPPFGVILINTCNPTIKYNMLMLLLYYHRSKILQVATKSTNAPSPPATIASKPNTTANTFTASATSIGRLRARRFRSTCME